MKKLIIRCSILLSLFVVMSPALSFAKQLDNFDDIQKAVEHGEKLTIVVNFAHCNLGIPISGIFSPRSIMVNKDVIAFSNRHFTTSNPQYDNKPLIEYTTYHVDPKGVHIRTEFFDAATYKSIDSMKPINVECALGNHQTSFFSD